MPNVGSYQFRGLPTGTYMLNLEVNETWATESLFYLGDAYSDGVAWYVDVNAEASAGVLVVRAPSISPIDTITPPTVATGYVVVTQVQCDGWTEQSPCLPVAEPSEVRLTNIETGEIWLLSEWGYNSSEGQWIMQLPTGGYTIEVPDIGGWQWEFPGWVDVLNDQESPVYIRGNPN